MFSQKTDNLILFGRKYKFLKDAILLTFAPEIDTRATNNTIKSRSGLEQQITARIKCGQDIINYISDNYFQTHIRQYNFVILIDEGQFIENLYQFCYWCLHVDTFANNNITFTVCISALDLTFQKKTWPEIEKVKTFCNDNDICHLSAVCGVCKCQPGIYTSRKQLPSNCEHQQDLIVIGDAESYVATCEQCYF